MDTDTVDRVYEALQCSMGNLSIMLVENISFHRQTCIILSTVIVYIIQIVEAVDLNDQPHWKESSVGMLGWTSNDSKK